MSKSSHLQNLFLLSHSSLQRHLTSTALGTCDGHHVLFDRPDNDKKQTAHELEIAVSYSCKSALSLITARSQSQEPSHVHVKSTYKPVTGVCVRTMQEIIPPAT